MNKLNRRDFIGAVAAAPCLATHDAWGAAPSALPAEQESLSAVATPPWEALELEPGRHLFVDNYLVASSQNLKATLHQPRKVSPPVIGAMGSGYNNYQPYATVLYDAERRRFRMWYNTRRSLVTDTQSLAGGQTYVSYIESADGIHWERPYRELFEILGFGSCVTDMGPNYGDPARRYQMIYWAQGHTGEQCTDGAAAERVAFSPDGLHWTPYAGNPVLPDLNKDNPACDPRKVGDVRWQDYAADCVHTVWDPARKIHVAYVKSWTWPPAEFDYISPTSGGRGQRLESACFSPDFVHWSAPVRCFLPEPDDVKSIEFGYAFRPKVRGNQLLILSCILDQGISTSKGNGIGYTVLSTTSDLVHCRRMKPAWLDRVAGDETAVDHAMAWIADMITVGDEEFVYYAGYRWGHKNFDDRTINLARLRKDGFVSRDAGNETGRLVTPLVRLRSGKLTVNAQVRGELRVRLLDAQNQPVAGLGEGQVAAITGDSTAHPVQSQGRLADFKGAPVRLEFSLRDGQLYGFELS